VESTGIVVTPYLEYPQLLGVLLRMLNEGTPPVRHEVLKARAPALRPGGSPACWEAALHSLQAALAMQSFVAAVKAMLCGWAAPTGMAGRQAGPMLKHCGCKAFAGSVRGYSHGCSCCAAEHILDGHDSYALGAPAHSVAPSSRALSPSL